MAEKTTIERLANFMSYSGHKSAYRVFVPTPSKSEKMTLPQITELDQYGGWVGWMKNYKGYTDTDIADWLKDRASNYKPDLNAAYEESKANSDEQPDKCNQEYEQEKTETTQNYDEQIQEENDSYTKTTTTPGSKYNPEQLKKKHETTLDRLNKQKENALKELEKQHKEDLEDWEDIKKEIAEADPSKSIKAFFNCTYTKKYAEQVYSSYTYLDKYTGELKESEIYEDGNVVVEVDQEASEYTSGEIGEEVQVTKQAKAVQRKWWRFAYDHSQHSSGQNPKCPPKGCSEDVKVYREKQDVTVTYQHKKGNRFTYKIEQVDKDSDKFRYYWFINDNATDSVSYLQDIGIYSSNAKKADNEGLARLINNIPSIKIVEFQPIIGIAETMKTMMQSFNLGLDIGSDLYKSITDPNSAKLADVIQSSCAYLYGYIVDGTLNKNIFDSNSTDIFAHDKTSKSGNLQNLEILQIPYLFYSKMLRSTNLNTYEFPFFGNYYMNGHGKQGWTSNSYTGGSGGSMVGKMLQIFNSMNIDIVSRPTFHLTGIGETADAIEFEVNLYNYDLASAAANFLLVNTIVPNNKWIQRGIFQQGSCLYDIQIPGRIRSFCCKANIAVEFLGIARSPSEVLLKEILKHINTADNKINPDDIYDLKIPDVYKLKFSFESLIPDNYNMYLFNYFNNCKIFEDAKIDPDSVDQKSAIDIGIEGIEKTIKMAVEKGEADANQKALDAAAKSNVDSGVNTLKAEIVDGGEKSNADAAKLKSNATNQ